MVKKTTSLVGHVANGRTGQATDVMSNLSASVLPILAKLKQKSMGGSGSIMTAGYGRIKVKLQKSLAKGIRGSFKYYLKHKNRKNPNRQSGKGLGGLGLSLAGGAFWDDFKRGFLSVFKPGAKIIGTVASAAGMPEFGIPLGLLAEAL